MEHLKRFPRLFFLGIGGTGMAAVAGLCKLAGYKVTGSDQNLYPPMSDTLRNLGIEVLTPYDQANISKSPADLYVVANALSRGHVELEEVLKRDLPYVSFPQLLGDTFLNQKTSIVVAGTHGKTTTSSLIAYLLNCLGLDPSFLIGGVPLDFGKGFHLSQRGLFVIEGDEYDTAFFDKESKFLHYRPKFVVLNNIEWDHVDIFKDLSAMKLMFSKLLDLVEDKRSIIANVDDPGVRSLLEERNLLDHVTRVSPKNLDPYAHVRLTASGYSAELGWWGELQLKNNIPLRFHTQLTGHHNLANIAISVALLERLGERGHLAFDSEDLGLHLSAFKGVKRRLEVLFKDRNVELYEDFAHHPTAVAEVIKGFKQAHPSRRLIVAFEPKNATSRRRTFFADYVRELSRADEVLLGAVPSDSRVRDEDKMQTQELATQIGSKAHAFERNEDLMKWIQTNLCKNDTVIFMSSGSFSGIQHSLARWLEIGQT